MERDSLANAKSIEHRGRLYKGVYPLLYLLGIGSAEIVIGYFNVHIGMILHFIIFTMIFCQAIFSLYRLEISCRGEQYPYHFYLSISLVPLIRILSLSVPLKAMPFHYWFFFVGIPILTAAYLVIKRTDFQKRDIYLSFGKGHFTWRSFSLQLAIGLTGFFLGLIQFYIVQPPDLPPLNWVETLLVVMSLLLFAGFTEELIFRGIIRKAVDDFLGREYSVMYVSLICAFMYITHLSFAFVFFVFGVSVVFTLISYRTESIMGIAIAHGLATVTYLLIAPQLFV
ncbi:MAG TPA: CPBP family intramembrane metalloprotease [Syntrophomonadaceae bacterium]|mgnify:CR=1 FL=1|nr:CPBP family intramembrane metalloprotease [Syntrophomonadaceae bacterium]